MNISTNYDVAFDDIKHRAFLLYWNEIRAQHLLPNTVMLVIYLLIGLAGNIAVILVYQFGFNKNTDGRYFIVPLAWVDTTALIVTGAINLTRNTKPVIFPGHGACKLLLYSSYVTTCTSLFLLNVIAVQRYLKICKPFGPQMNILWNRLSVVICAIASILLYMPVLFYYGIVDTRNHSSWNISGYECNQLPGSTDQQKGFKIFQGVGFFVTIANLLTITVLYIVIAIAIMKQLKKMKVVKVGRDNVSVATLDTIEQTYVPSVQVNFQTATSDTDFTIETSNRINEPQEKHFTQTATRKSTFRISFMFMAITIVAFLAYLPTCIFIVIETNNPAFWNDLTPTAFHICLTLRRMYMVNHFSNPFMYGAFDNAFREKIKKMFCKK
ncbi:nematocin receptor 2-like [Mytilus trossulus]|uniref:nematocin receptor 2-like n=1 Tax=Mytilus trossulus TaxID=6551 RepID=UPI00300485B8